MTGDIWKDLAAAALIGTDRRPLNIPQAEGALGVALAQIDPTEPERALLRAAALVALHRRAGYTLLVDHRPLPPRCEPEEQPICSPPAARQLGEMLGKQQEYGLILKQWLGLAAAKGYRVPEAYLPRLLEVGRLNISLQMPIIPVIGKRGRWLAGQNPQWDFAAVGEDWSDWRVGSSTGRAWLLLRLRKEDPARARELLASTWEEEDLNSRKALIHALEAELNLADEAFLETALSDKSEHVRQHAAWMLMRLPESRLYRSTLERLTPLVKVVKPLLGKARAEITLPARIDKVMLQNGISAEPPRGRLALGKRANALVEMLEIIQPSHWLTTFKISAADLVAALENSRWDDDAAAALAEAKKKAEDKTDPAAAFRRALLEALAMAAVHHRDAAVAAAFIEADFTHVVITPHLLELQTPKEREALALRTLKANPDVRDDSHPALKRLSELSVVDHQWSAELTRAFIDSLKHTIQPLQGYKEINDLLGRVKNFIIHMDPAFAKDLEALADKEKSHLYYWNRAISHHADLLRFRQKMLKELV